MENALLASLSGLPSFLLYMGVAVGLFVAFMKIYALVTPHDEHALIRANNAAASISYSGAMIGFVLPIASAVQNSINVVDVLVWGVVAGVVQILCFLIFRLFYSDIVARIEQGQTAAAMHLAAVSLSVGLLNAAAMTY
jgi:putative membrane protein